jgi:hypothetical protein
MGKSVVQNLLVRVLVLSLLIATQQGCSWFDPITSWDSPRLLKIKEKWDSIWRPSAKSKDEFQKLEDRLGDVLVQNLSRSDLHRLAATSGSLPSRSKERSEFTNAVLAYMARVFICEGDRSNLVALLVGRFPDEPFHKERIEYSMAAHEKDWILLFGDAYAKCQDAKNRRHLAVAVRRAFIGSGIRGQNDDEFVKNAMQWYRKEKGHLALNPRARYRALSYDEFAGAYDDDRTSEAWRIFGESVWPNYEKQPLFVEKSSVPGRKAE